MVCPAVYASLEAIVPSLNMSFNTKKTVCMVFNPVARHKIVCTSFPQFALADSLQFVTLIKYRGLYY